MRPRARRLAPLLAPLLAPIAALSLALVTGLGGCSGNRAYLDWRPGLSEIDFDGVFEISRAELDSFTSEGEANTRFDRLGGIASADASTRMLALGERLAADSGGADVRGYSILGLGGDGRVVLRGDRGRDYAGTVDWFAQTDDAGYAALISGNKLVAVSDGASTGIDVGSLLGNSVAGQRLLLVVRDAELTVFALPELGGVVAANEPGYLFAFRHQPGARDPWEVSVARVVVTP